MDFVQTFFLATEERRYYVFNDILRHTQERQPAYTRPVRLFCLLVSVHLVSV